MSQMNSSRFLVVVALLLAGHLHAGPEGVNGGVIAVKLPVGAKAAVFNNENQLIIDNTAIVGIPFDQEPGIAKLQIELGRNLIDELPMEVVAKEYPEQHITIEDENMVTPPPETLERIQRESALMREAYARRSPAMDGLFPLVVPVTGQISGVFGSRRFFNGKPRNPHSGIDYAADTGTPIQSPAPGTIALTGDFYFNGNTVVIDHGSGFLSVMCHLHEIQVEQDQEVKKGEVIGTVGSTGRSTGPHLHWTISLQGTKVDPAVMIEVTNDLIEEQSPSTE